MNGITSFVENFLSSSTAIGVIAGFISKVLLDRLTQSNKRDIELDTDMRKRRLDVYPALWKMTSLLPRWPRDDTITFEQFAALQLSMKDWYFNTGGIYLSRSTFAKAYVPLQDKLTEILLMNGKGPIPSIKAVLDGERDVYEDVRELCSALRSALTEDVQSRREAPLWSWNM